MTGWEEALAWCSGGPNRFVNSRYGAELEPGTFCVTVGLCEKRRVSSAVFEHAYGVTLDEAAANALAAWRKRML